MLRRLTPLSLVLALLMSMGFFVPAHASTPVTGAEEDLGHAIPGSFLSPESSLGVAEDGRLLAFYVSNGNAEIPMMLQVVDVEAQETIYQQRVPAGVNSWANDYSDVEKKVYFASTDGHFYSWKPGDADITDLGQPAVDGDGIWRLAVAPDGVVYGGTYPSGHLFAYDPATGETRNYGQVNPGETYVRSIAVDEQYAYVGSQPNAKLTRVDRETGEATPMSVPLENHSAVYDLTLAGDFLFARVEGSNTLLVYDRKTLEIVNTVEKITGRVISEVDPTGEFVVFRMNNGVDPHGIYRYYLADHSIEFTGFSPNAFPGSFIWYEFSDQETYTGHTLVLTFYRGRTYGRNFESNKDFYIGEGILEKTPNPIQELAAGPDGKIYVPGFLSPPSMAQFDPATDTYAQLGGAGQVEGLGTFDDLLLMGRYPSGGLTAFDTTQEWKYPGNPPERIPIGYDQDRPQSFARVGDEVAVTSIPKSGRLGGAITMWNPVTYDMRTYVDIVENQAPVSVAEKDGLIYFGTTINGGYGIDPVETDARLGIMDPATGEVLFETIPVPGAMNVTALTFDSEGTLWAIADGSLLTFNTETREVERVEQVFPKTRTMYGTTNTLLFHEDGYIYSTSAGSLWRVDPVTWERVRMAHTGVKYLAQDESGNLYYARVSKLFRWNFGLEATGDLTAPVTTAKVDNQGGEVGTVALTLTATDEGTGVASTEYRVNGGEWTAYEMAIQFDTAGEYIIEYRSTDRNANVEGTKSVEVTVVEAAPAPDAAVTIDAASTKLVGSTTYVWGTISGTDEHSVTVERQDGDSWAKIAEGTARDDGTYVINIADGTNSAGEHVLRVVVGDEVSDEITVTRLARSSSTAAASAKVGQRSHVWGTVHGPAKIQTQVKLASGWVTSQKQVVDGGYVIPLTYGVNSAGSLGWRVVVLHDHGEVEYLPEFTQMRYAAPSVNSAGVAPVGQTASVWGTVPGQAYAEVWTEVQLSDGTWARSQTVTTNARGGYVIELTYGKNVAGTYRWRVAAKYDGIGVVRSVAFTFVRI